MLKKALEQKEYLAMVLKVIDSSEFTTYESLSEKYCREVENFNPLNTKMRNSDLANFILLLHDFYSIIQEEYSVVQAELSSQKASCSSSTASNEIQSLTPEHQVFEYAFSDIVQTMKDVNLAIQKDREKEAKPSNVMRSLDMTAEEERRQWRMGSTGEFQCYPVREGLEQCLFCQHFNVDYPPSNKDAVQKGRTMVRDHEVLLERWDAYEKSKGTKNPLPAPLTQTGKPWTRRPDLAMAIPVESLYPATD